MGSSFCKAEKKEKTRGEVKWANTLAVPACAHGEPAHADAAGNPPGRVHSPEKSETTDKHPSKPKAAPPAIAFPAVHACTLIDSAPPSAERDPGGSRLAACFVSWGWPLSARSGALRDVGSQAQALPLAGGRSRCAPRPLGGGRAPRPPPNNASLPSLRPPSEGRKGGGEGEGNSKALEI